MCSSEVSTFVFCWVFFWCGTKSQQKHGGSMQQRRLDSCTTSTASFLQVLWLRTKFYRESVCHKRDKTSPGTDSTSTAILRETSQMKCYLTQNMQDRQTQVRAGPARAAGRLRETDGMVTSWSDAAAAAAAAATDQRASSCIIQPGEVLPDAAEPWLSCLQTLVRTAWLASFFSSKLDPDCLPSLLLSSAHSASPPLCRGNFHKAFFFFWRGVEGGKEGRRWGSGCPHHSTGVKGEGGALLIIHLFCPSSLSLALSHPHVSLPSPPL